MNVSNTNRPDPENNESSVSLLEILLVILRYKKFITLGTIIGLVAGLGIFYGAWHTLGRQAMASATVVSATGTNLKSLTLLKPISDLSHITVCKSAESACMLAITVDPNIDGGLRVEFHAKDTATANTGIRAVYAAILRWDEKAGLTPNARQLTLLSHMQQLNQTRIAGIAARIGKVTLADTQVRMPAIWMAARQQADWFVSQHLSSDRSACVAALTLLTEGKNSFPQVKDLHTAEVMRWIYLNALGQALQEHMDLLHSIAGYDIIMGPVTTSASSSKMLANPLFMAIEGAIAGLLVFTFCALFLSFIEKAPADHPIRKNIDAIKSAWRSY